MLLPLSTLTVPIIQTILIPTPYTLPVLYILHLSYTRSHIGINLSHPNMTPHHNPYLRGSSKPAFLKCGRMSTLFPMSLFTSHHGSTPLLLPLPSRYMQSSPASQAPQPSPSLRGPRWMPQRQRGLRRRDSRTRRGW